MEPGFDGFRSTSFPSPFTHFIPGSFLLKKDRTDFLVLIFHTAVFLPSKCILRKLCLFVLVVLVIGKIMFIFVTSVQLYNPSKILCDFFYLLPHSFPLPQVNYICCTYTTTSVYTSCCTN